MAWIAPMTATAAATLTAAQYNMYIRDNFLELGVARLISPRGTMRVSATNQVLGAYPVGSALVTAFENTTSVDYTDLTTPGPSVTLNTGSKAIVMFSSAMTSSINEAQSTISYEVSGATNIQAAEWFGLTRDNLTAGDGWRAGVSFSVTTLNAGSNTFKMKYRVNSASNTGTFGRRQIIVFPF